MGAIGNPEQIFPIFFGVWIILSVGSVYLFYISKDVERKKKLFKPFLFATGALFVGFVWVMGLPAPMLAFFAPAVFLVMYVHSRMVRFCDACGHTVMRQLPFSPPKHCSNCGAAL